MTQPTRKIGRYEILSRVGQGGMGVLYRAHDPVLDRDVAIKMMLVDLASEPGARERFEREARAIAKLQHRNVVTIHEFGECDDSPYIVMEFLGGHDLEALMRRVPPLSLDEKLDIVIQLCAGLSFAHERGIVHRDVKPSNVRVLEDGTVKILDFGIAKMAQSGTTARGQLMGSPSYMAPELLSEGPIDGRADVFSTGVVLYELLSGRKPFVGDSPTSIVYQILHAQPAALTDVAPGLPPQLPAVVERALEKDPDRRYARASELMADLQLVRLSAVTPSGPTTPIPRPRPAESRGLSDTRAGVAGTAASDVLSQPSFPVAEPAESPLAPVGPEAPTRRRVATGAAIGLAAVVAVVGLAGALWWMTRALRGTAAVGSPAGPAAAPAVAARAEPVVAAPPAPAARALQIETDPPGAQIFLDDRDTKLATPATVEIEGPLPKVLRLAKEGYRSETIAIGAADLAGGARRVELVRAPEPPREPGVVELSGEYAFSVLEGAKVLSESSSTHELTLPARATKLTLRNPEYFLDQTVSVTPDPKRRRQISAPGLGTLTIYAANETCPIKIDGVDVGFHPIAARPAAAGWHRVSLECPGRPPLVKKVEVRAGEQTTVTFEPIGARDADCHG